jgi:predicted CXXCH cytochrome family protein
MKNLMILFLITLFNYFAFGQAASKDQCLTCHSEVVGGAPAALFKNDIHYKMGLTCADCHGGNSKTDDMDAAMSKEAGFIGIPKGNTISEICAKCHASKEKMASFGVKIPTDQFELLKTSVHGALSTNGKDRIAQCINCHGAHGIVKVTNPKSPVYPLNVPKTCAKCHSNAVYMRNYDPKLPIDQYDKYRTSVHGILNAKGDPKPAQCESCHGSHGILAPSNLNSSVYVVNVPKTCSKCHSNKEYMKKYKIPTDQYANYSKSVHGIALLKKKDTGAPACNSCHGNHGATPPGIASISQVCGTCHALNAELFESSPHKEAFDKENYPECQTCHSNHLIITATDKLLGVSKGAVCLKCHTPEKNPKGYFVAKDMKSLLDSLEVAQKYADTLIYDAEQKGMEVEDEKFELRDANQAILEAKTAVHSFNEKKFNDIVEGKGLKVTNKVIKDAKASIDEYYFRRKGLGIALIITILLAIGLYLYIKDYEKNQKKNE